MVVSSIATKRKQLYGLVPIHSQCFRCLMINRSMPSSLVVRQAIVAVCFVLLLLEHQTGKMLGVVTLNENHDQL